MKRGPRVVVALALVAVLMMVGQAQAQAVDSLTVTVTPATSTNMVTALHTVTATVKDSGGVPVSGATVLFSVAGANVGATCTQVGGNVQATDANGQASCSYVGTVTARTRSPPLRPSARTAPSSVRARARL